MDYFDFKGNVASIMAFFIAINMYMFPINNIKSNECNYNRKNTSQQYIFNDRVKARFYLGYLKKKITKDFEINVDNYPEIDGSVDTSLLICEKVRDELSNVSNDEKLEFILDYYKIDSEEFDVIQAIVNKEARGEDEENLGYRYIDSFSVINSIYNRMISKTKSQYVKSWLKLDREPTLYDHVVAPSQFAPYESGIYKDALGTLDGESYQAVLDFLYVAGKYNITMHPYMDFVGNGYESYSRIKFVPKGNNFSNILMEDDIIPLEERYYYEDNQLILN